MINDMEGDTKDTLMGTYIKESFSMAKLTERAGITGFLQEKSTMESGLKALGMATEFGKESKRMMTAPSHKLEIPI